jgi:hypothetical protein
MRLDATKGDRDWNVWHVAEARRPHAVWVDSDTAQWCEAPRPLHLVNGGLHTVTRQARQITINVEQRLILIDPVDDDAGEVDQIEVRVGTPAGQHT